MKGTLCAVGAGPGDPELLTLKAVKLIRRSQVIAIPHRDPARCAAYKIVRQAMPEIEEKELVCIDMPMTKEKEKLKESHERGAERLAELLAHGRNVALLTLGDPTVYATSAYLLDRVRQIGYPVEMVNGIPSFCAAAACLETVLAKGEEEVHILPGSYEIQESLGLPGVKVLMKLGSAYPKLVNFLRNSNYQAVMVENCGREGQRIYHGVEEFPESVGYYALMIVRDGSESESEEVSSIFVS